MSELEGRDLAVVQLVARFKQMSSRQIHDVLFTNCASHTPCHRSLARLTAQSFLFQIERRIVGGSHGGSGQYVYTLGRRGFFMTNPPGRFQPPRAINYHSLAIGDCFITLRRLESEGRLRLIGFSTEPDCWATVGGVQLKPDLYVDIEIRGERVKLWCEIDMGSEAQRQLRGKLEAYWRAWSDADVNQWPVFPRVLWIAVDEERDKELRWVIEQGPKDAQALFQVTTKDKLHTLFMG